MEEKTKFRCPSYANSHAPRRKNAQVSAIDFTLFLRVQGGSFARQLYRTNQVTSRDYFGKEGASPSRPHPRALSRDWCSPRLGHLGARLLLLPMPPSEIRLFVVRQVGDEGAATWCVLPFLLYASSHLIGRRGTQLFRFPPGAQSTDSALIAVTYSVYAVPSTGWKDSYP